MYKQTQIHNYKIINPSQHTTYVRLICKIDYIWLSIESLFADF